MRFAALFAVLLAVSAHAADTPDPLPEGAKLRLGSDRMRFGYGTLTPDGKHLVANRGSKTVLVDVTTGRDDGELKYLVTHFSADGKWAASASGLVNVWELPAGKPQQVTKRQFSNAAIEPVSLSADGSVLAIGAEKGAVGADKHTAIVWDVRAGKQLAEVSPEQNRYVGVRISPDGKTLATFGRHDDPTRKFGERNPDGWPEQAVQLWNAADGKLLARFAVQGRTVVAVAFSPDSSLLAVSAADGLVSLREARTGKEGRQLFGRSYIGTRLAFSPDGKTLAAAGMDGRVQRWNVAGGKMLGSTEPVTGPHGTPSFILRDLAFTAPDRAVMWGALGSHAAVYEIPSGKRLSPAVGETRAVTGVGFPADGKHVLTSGYDGGMLRWDAKTGELLGSAPVRAGWGGGYALPLVQVLPDGARAVQRGGPSVYDVAAGTELFRLPVSENNRGAGYIVRTSHDGTKAVTRLAADKEKTDRYEAWDLVAPKKLGEIDMPTSDLRTADVSTDGKHLVTFTQRGIGDVSGWDVATGKQLGVVSVPGGTTVVAVPGTGSLALVPTKDGKFAVVDYAAGKVTATLDAGRTDMTGVPVFAADGNSFAAAFWKYEVKEALQRAEIRVYAWPGGEVRHTFRGHAEQVYCLAFSPDGKTLASGSLDTTVLLWDVTKK